jgi:hypothetical protein
LPVFIRQYHSFQCLLSVPPHTATASALRPVLVFLHGRDEASPPLPGSSPNIMEKLTLHGPLATSSAKIGINDFVVVAPQLAAPGGDVWSKHKVTVADLARNVAADHGGDLTRMYLTGFSYGGNGVLSLGQDPSGPWAALWAVDPPAVPAGCPPCPVWLSAGRYAHPQAAAFTSILRLQQAAAASSTASVYDYVAPGHGETAQLAYADPRVYLWLLTHRRGG